MGSKSPFFPEGSAREATSAGLLCKWPRNDKLHARPSGPHLQGHHQGWLQRGATTTVPRAATMKTGGGARLVVCGTDWGRDIWGNMHNGG